MSRPTEEELKKWEISETERMIAEGILVPALKEKAKDFTVIIRDDEEAFIYDTWYCKSCDAHCDVSWQRCVNCEGEISKNRTTIDTICSERDCNNLATNGDGLCIPCMHEAINDYCVF